jgi:hypothetical protein
MIPSSYVALFLIVSIHHIIHRLLTPPATPLCFPAATSGSTAALNRLTRATSASYAKSNSPVCACLVVQFSSIHVFLFVGMIV